MSDPSSRRYPNGRLVGGCLLGLILISVAAWLIAHHVNLVGHLITIFNNLYARSPVLCIVLFGILQIIIAICGVLPASTGAIASGMIFGIWSGFGLAAATTLSGAVVAFSLSRSIFRHRIYAIIQRYRLMSALDTVVTDQGWRIVCLMRLSPVLPFAVTSYALGMTKISTKSYLIGTFASLPPLLGYVVLGHLTGVGVSSVASGSISWIRCILLIMAGGGTILLTLQIARLLAKQLKSSIEET